ncbi:MAG: ABC transporter permease [Verrucomicrobia bacterium]|nr:ABC transporter permease [Verrucomicrobiota bacterium]
MSDVVLGMENLTRRFGTFTAVDAVTLSVNAGEVFARSGAMPTGNIPYLDFIAPGILAQSVLFVAIFYGINVIWERDLGIVRRFLASPTPRAALVLGKGLSAGVRTLSQAAIVYTISLFLGVKLSWSPAGLLNVLVIVIIATTMFATFSLIIACLVKTCERFMGVGQSLTMPLFFASSAIYPTDIMPGWLKTISRLNPLTYVVDALRATMLTGSTSTFGLRYDYAVMLLTTAALVLVCARLYPRLAI